MTTSPPQSVEEAFRADLREHARAERWPAWHAIRKVFADWLEDERRGGEAAFTRAGWVLARRWAVYQGRHWVEVWEVSRAAFCQFPTKGLRHFNARPLLHFAPGHLHLIEHGFLGKLTFRHHTFNKQYAAQRADTSRHPEGFGALFLQKEVVPCVLNEEGEMVPANRHDAGPLFQWRPGT